MAKPPQPPFELPPSEKTSTDPLIREALAWLVHLHSGDEKPEDWAAFEDWQAASEDHRRAGAAAKQLWEQVGPALVQGRKSRNRSIPVVLAVAIGLSALAFFSGLFGPPASFFADYRSSTGEVRSVTLRDGSKVDLDTGTSFDVSDDDRTIILYTGQVFVAVSPDPARPFTVLAGTGRVHAIGTAFAVRRDANRVTVLVSESAVRVNVSRRGAARTADIAAGQAITFSPAELGAPETVDVAALTGWRRGELVFHDRPLGAVIAELERYRRGKIFILDAAIEQLAVTGNFDIRDPDAFLESLQLALPVRVHRMPGIAVIRRDPARLLPAR